MSQPRAGQNVIRVSAIIPVYNGAATVGCAIRSVLAQQFDGLEIIVVDDGSTDSTPAALEEWGARIRVIRQPNRGPAAARNNGARTARGEYLAFLDADDAWLPGKLIAMVPALDRAQPQAVLAYSRFTQVDSSGREVEEPFFTTDCDHAPSMNDMLARWWPILTSTVVMRRDTFEACGGFSEEFRLAGYEDPYLWIVARERGEFVYLPQSLAVYRSEAALDRMKKYVPGFAIFVRLIRQRYGPAGNPLIRELTRAQVSSLGYQGLLAMRRGDKRDARRAFMLALRYNPRSLRSAARLLRTFLPLNLAQALTGRTRSKPA